MLYRKKKIKNIISKFWKKINQNKKKNFPNIYILKYVKKKK